MSEIIRTPIALTLASTVLVGCAAPAAVATPGEQTAPGERAMLGGHFQNAYVTRDLDKAIARLKSQYGIGEVMRFSPELHITTPDGPQTLRLEVGLAWVGAYQIEIIEPVAGYVELYRDFLPETDDGAMRFHHIGLRVGDFAAVRATLGGQGAPVAFEVSQDGLRGVYVDARATLGHYVEYVWLSAQRWAEMGGPR